MSGPGFAVIDFETTGLFPNGNDRVIEVAIVHVDELGRIEGHWDTLVNPGRDLGRPDIHRIRAADVMNAPTFDQIASKLVELLAGRVLVAHNANFDTRFLIAELQRAGHWTTSNVVTLCTMQLARDFLPGTGRSLADCCAAYDIELDGAHRASVDAAATARLLGAYVESANDPEFWGGPIIEAFDYRWPGMTPQDIAWYPRPDSAHPMTAASFLARMTHSLPDVAGPAEYVDYLALLDRCLLDRHLSAHEAEALVQLADELGISRHSCEALHLEYFAGLTRIAWEDGILTMDEMADLVDVGNLLDLSLEAISAALEAPTPLASESLAGVDPASAFALQPGDLVVLTGDMTRPREAWEGELLARGFTPWRAVTKKVKLVVAADPDSLSGKARKARDYGIPIVDEAALERMTRNG
ncbi:exonuclease domain-containing protein [Cryobacterium psychrophilum]|uniref:DNA polymerase III subunit epsilon n=1 Tax=Cryobacterium psychrophilum TaxID=41988 RepID=A0A4Y8KM22_9MICO|nr:exonuclease domain-containing protein [Cryobacterium psychrophilum]TDW31086.1 DNA polymerase-3 subunit epsilon [Cryobacterium psychrophilum]TFD78613.1 DNA polymerase III subunit epsilon [Cryobacterium psychrophilum]